jgi:hypothetical protein
VTLSDQQRQQILRALTGELMLAEEELAARGVSEDRLDQLWQERIAAVRSVIPVGDDGEDRRNHAVGDRGVVQEG